MKRAQRTLMRSPALAAALRAKLTSERGIPLLVLRLPEFAQLAWRISKRAAQRMERSTADAFSHASRRVMRDEDAIAHDPGSDWFAAAMLAPARNGLATALDARAALERISATIALHTGRRMETGWWLVAGRDEIDALEATVERALERGARERERYEFLATVGHELRTPLTSIRGYIETLLDGDVDPTTARRFLETARSEALRLGRLVDGIVDFSLLDLSPHVRAAATDMGSAVRSALESLAPIAREAGIALAARLEDGLEARIDADACMHALLNLIENAIKYGRRHGRVLVSLERQDPYVCVVVDDDGPGINAGERERVFEHRARAAGAPDARGNGIGLAIVRTILERAGGRVNAEESPLGGARFIARFASSKAESSAPAS